MEANLLEEASAELEAFDAAEKVLVFSSRKVWKARRRKPPCACGGVHFAKGKCKSCYFREYNLRERPSRQAGNIEVVREWAPEQEARCRNRWCKRLLPVQVLRSGVVEIGSCEPCGRYAKGLCYACNKPLPFVNTQKVKRWHSRCYERRRGPRKEVREKSRKKDRKKAIVRSHKYYATTRRQELEFQRKQRLAVRNGKLIKNYHLHERPCPECGRPMQYRSRPPLRCDLCWSKESK